MEPAAERLHGKGALITGASRGIGRAIAGAFAAEGANVALLSRDEVALEALADELAAAYDVDTVVVPADVTETPAVTAAVQEAIDQFDGLDVLVNNAGLGAVGYDEQLTQVDPTDCARVIETNLTGAITVTHAALPAITSAQGTVIFIGSSAAMRPRGGAMIYAASKWGLRGFALSLEANVGQDGVAVSTIHTSLVRTDRWADVPPGEAAEPDEIARAAIYAATQPPHSTVSELTLHRRDILGSFVPSEIDLERPFDDPSEPSGP